MKPPAYGAAKQMMRILSSGPAVGQNDQSFAPLVF
jgi:hypothetical protein